MKKNYGVSLVCLSVVLLVFGACNNPDSPAVTEEPAYQERPGKEVPPGKTADPDDPEEEDQDDSESPDDPDEPAGGDDTDDGEEAVPEAEGAVGTLSYTVEFPGDVVRSALMTLSIRETTGHYRTSRILDLRETYTGTAGTGSITLPSGSYRLELALNSLYPRIVRTENVTMYPGTETVAPVYHVEAAEFENPVPVNGTGDLQHYLEELPQNTETDPYLIRVGGVDLASAKTGAAENTLKNLYTALSRYVALDLSDCFGESLPSFTSNTAPHKANILAVLLPEELRTIKSNAFTGCTALVSADMPGVTTIMQGAFSGCVKLETVYLENLGAIKNDGSTTNGAFHQCSALSTVFLPKAEEIGKKTFNSCTALSVVYVPRVTTIGDRAFAGCTGLDCLILGETPPELGEAVFAGNKPERIYVPAAAVDAYKNTLTKGWTDALKAKIRAVP
ncbi:MAG: leucine-rich repeat domain-containing protein [Treponema sp.]|jgi:hypothetical protein|nr:leucine-rich repeat domain-containing protein [Treponema sp.]